MTGFSTQTLPKLEKAMGQIYLVRFSSQKVMCRTMLRFQEYSESPKFKGQFFTFNEYKEWYIKKNGEFSYYTDWDGFNVPSRVFAPFRDGRFGLLTDEEESLLDAVEHLQEPFYLIAVAEEGSNPTTLRHEIAHGLFSTNEDYRAEVYMMLRDIQLSPLIRWLMNKGYHWSVLLDECHAYLMADFDWLIEDEKLKLEGLSDIHDGLRWAFDYYTDGRFKEKKDEPISATTE